MAPTATSSTDGATAAATAVDAEESSAAASETMSTEMKTDASQPPPPLGADDDEKRGNDEDDDDGDIDGGDDGATPPTTSTTTPQHQSQPEGEGETSSSAAAAQPPQQQQQQQTTDTDKQSQPQQLQHASVKRTVARPPLNVYRKVTIVRSDADTVTYEDPTTGKWQTASDLGSAATTAAPAHQAKPKADIPVPRISIVDEYDTSVPPTYAVPSSFVRYAPPLAQKTPQEQQEASATAAAAAAATTEYGVLGSGGVAGGETKGGVVRAEEEDQEEDVVEYNVDEEDECWLHDHPTLGIVKKRLPPPPTASTEAPSAGALGIEAVAAAAVSPKEEAQGPTATGGVEDSTAASGGGGGSGVNKKKRKKSDVTSATTTTTSTVTAPKEEVNDEPSSAMDVDSTSGVDVTTTDESDDDDEYDMDEWEEEECDPKTGRPRPALPVDAFERMIDCLEKATGYETIITISQAERLLVANVPVLLHRFGSGGGGGAGGRDKRGRWRGRRGDTAARADGRRRGSGSRGASSDGIGRGGEGPTVKSAIRDVYDYWVSKRSKLRKPLLRRYWPVTASNDTNPHLVFRPREKEKYKLRKKRQNDMEAYRKMQQLRTDFDKVRVLLDLVRRREALHRTLVDLDADRFEQRLYDAVDTSGLPRVSLRLDRDGLKNVLDVPERFDSSAVTLKKKKRKRGSTASAGGGGGGGSAAAAAASGNESSRAATPVPASAGTVGGTAVVVGGTASGVGDGTSTVGRTIAGQDHGTPAPLFLHPLIGRESYATSWDDAVPFVSTYVRGHATPTFRFRHRPRVGRGGRIVIDRLPRPPPSSVGHPAMDAAAAAVTVFTAGDGLGRSGYDVEVERVGDGVTGELGGPTTVRAPPAERLENLLPPVLDHAKLSRRIEEMCAEALSDDEDGAGVGGSGVAPSAGGASASAGATAGVGGDAEENDGEAVLVRVEDWLEMDDQIFGEERFAIGPV